MEAPLKAGLFCYTIESIIFKQNYMNPQIQAIRDYVKSEIQNSPDCYEWFWDEHVSVVEKLAKELIKTQPSANVEIVLLSVYFHDLWGADFSKRYLTEHGFSEEIINGVYHSCMAHRVKEVMPETVEAKILATADALSHFENGFYMRIFYSWGKRMTDYQEMRNKLMKKIERDFNQKIFFTEAKKAVEPMYLGWKTALGSIKWD